MNGAMFNSLARFIDKHYPRVSFSDVCRKASLNTNVFAELTWYPDNDLPNMMDALSEQTETEPSTLWREFGRETFSYFADIFGDYMGEVVSLSDLITAVNRIHQAISRDGLGTPPRLEFRKAQQDHFEIRYSSDRKLDDFFLGMLEGASKHFRSEVKILGRKQRGKLVVTIHTKEPEMATV
jgi:methyl-accepting chemotaxis protein